jgi:hypothetical protein
MSSAARPVLAAGGGINRDAASDGRLLGILCFVSRVALSRPVVRATEMRFPSGVGGTVPGDARHWIASTRLLVCQQVGSQLPQDRGVIPGDPELGRPRSYRLPPGIAFSAGTAAYPLDVGVMSLKRWPNEPNAPIVMARAMTAVTRATNCADRRRPCPRGMWQIV